MKFVPEIRQALRPLRPALAPVMLVSAVLNVLMLGGSFFMLLVYDEVLPSRSVPTLVGLIGIVAVVYAFQGVLDFLRARIMVHLGTIVSGRLSRRVLHLLSRYEHTAGPLRNGTQPVRDLDQVRGFLSGPGPLAFLDLPWVVLYLAVILIFHWSLFLLTLLGVLGLVGLMIWTDRATSRRLKEVADLTASRFTIAENIRRNSEAMWAMGMVGRMERAWLALEERGAALNDRLARVSSSMSGLTRSLRMFLQSMVLALGAYLVILGEATGGIIIAGSILAARAVAPVEMVIAQWKGAATALQSLRRLQDMMERVPEPVEPAPLPLPTRNLDVQRVASGPPGSRKVTIADVTFALKAGDAVAIIGRSGSGKSSLVKAVTGLWPVLNGSVRLDGATTNQWSPDVLGQTIGYMPQSIEMFPGTVAQNIARFDPAANMDDVLAAARAADLHDFIVHLEGGYNFVLGPEGGVLSAGQMQRLALARALYRDPFLLVLDEPNSNLDADGEVALGKAIGEARARGAVVLIVAHRPSILEFVSHVLVMNGGRVEQFGTPDSVQVGTQRVTAQQPA